MNPRQLTLRSFLILALMLVLLPIVAISGWFSYRTAVDASDQFTLELARKAGDRVYDQVVTFFDVPRRVVAFNVEQARAGLLGEENRDVLMQRFLLQIRQQPQLTFVSMGMADGEYYAGSRPPLGPDRALRMMHSRAGDGRLMRMYRVDEAYQRGDEIPQAATKPFDARLRPWFKAAVKNGGIAWYAAYRYAVQDRLQAYNTMGIGMSAPMFGSKGEFLGVTTADVALSQLSTHLNKLVSSVGGVAYIAEEGGELLAASTPEPLFHLSDGKAVRVKVAESGNPLLHEMGRVVHESGRPDFHSSMMVKGEQHLIDWRTYQVPKGPLVTIGIALPNARFADVAQGMLRNTAYLALALAVFSIIMGLFASYWVARPLVALSRSSAKLATGKWQAGKWQASAQDISPIREVTSLIVAMDDLAMQLHRHTEGLEQLVEERTAALSESNGALLAACKAAENSQQHAEEARRQATQALHDLRATQNQLIQAEKMASLGQLVASVAHEINTPIGVVKSSGKSIDGELAHTLDCLPRLIDMLDQQTRELFLGLIDGARTSQVTLSSREERLVKGAVRQVLESAGIIDADNKANILVQLGAQQVVSKYLPLLQHRECDFILSTAYSIGAIVHGTQNINAAVDRVARIVFALRSFVSIDATGEKIVANLEEGVESVLKLYQSQIKQGVELVRQYQKIPPVPCRVDELNQVWTHLILNALQAMNNHGTLTIGMERKGDEVVVSIRDSGCGIPEQVRDQVFEPFFTTKQTGEGSGLGLGIVKKIVDAHDGRIALHSQTGEGTTVLVYLPVDIRPLA